MENARFTRKEINDAKMLIAADFMDRYNKWLEDIKTLDEKEFQDKYCYYLDYTKEATNNGKDCLSSLYLFYKKLYAGRYLKKWEKFGISNYMVWTLHDEGFFNLRTNTSWKARQDGTDYFYYMPQNKVREIYKYFTKK